MNPWSSCLLGADMVERRLEFAHLPQGWFAVGGVVLLILLLNSVIFFYRREQRAGSSRAMRLFLASLRCLVIVILAIVWLEPILATYVHRRIESQTLVLVDQSASMGLRDRYPDARDAERVRKVLPQTQDPSRVSRAEVARTLLAQGDGKLISELANSNAVQIYGFGDRLHRYAQIAQGGVAVAARQQPTTQEAASRPSEGAAALLPNPLDAKAPATDIGRAVRQAIESQAGAPITAVVVLSDGRFNQGEPADVIGRYARSKRIPIHTVGIGDPSPARNLTVSAVDAPPNVFVKDPFKVVAHLRAQGVESTSVTVELMEARQGSAPQVVETRQVAIGAGGRAEPVVFNRQIGEAADVNLVVRVQPETGETLLDDNQKQVTVHALESKMRVLIVGGAPSWEYRYLSRLLQRDATVNLSCWLQSADEDAVRDGNTVIDHFPRQPEELFQYACIILVDPQARDFDPGWAANMEALVGSYGGGLLLVCGRENTPRFMHDPNTRPLIDLLPVVIDPNESDLLINELGHYQATAWPLVVPPEVAGNPVLAMSEQPGENAQIWSRLPGVYWHYPVRREKPVATVLLRHSNPRMRNSYGGHVLLATQFFGSGRTGFLGFDSTWRWRRYGDRYFNRFWIQLLRHMVEGKLLTGQARGMIQMERDTYAVGEPVTAEARLLDARHLPLSQEQVQVTVRLEGQPDRAITMTAQPNRPGWYRGQFVPTEIGTHLLHIDLPGGEGVPPASIRGELRVGQADLEFRDPQLDRDSLATLAVQSAGGRYFDVDQIEELVAAIPSRTSTLVLTGQPITLWDRWWTLLLVVGLLGLEWALRKRARLL